MWCVGTSLTNGNGGAKDNYKKEEEASYVLPAICSRPVASLLEFTLDVLHDERFGKNIHYNNHSVKQIVLFI